MAEDFLPVCEPTFLGNEQKYVSEAMNGGWISSSGKFVGAFEEAFAQYCGVKYAVAVCNGTVALHLALRALDIGPDDEVIIPDFTMIATAAAVCYTGARPVFVEARPDTWNIDPEKIEEKISRKTKAILPVHIMGLPCNMQAIQKIAQKHGLKILEDAAEAHGAEINGNRAGSFSEIATFSFFANKNLTTGEGGMIVTSDPHLRDRARYLKNLAFPLTAAREYFHEEIGFNYRMSNLHAAIGLAQVEKADEYRNLRIGNHRLYRKYLAGIPGILHQFDPFYQERKTENALHVHWMNAIQIDPAVYGMSRDDLMTHLKGRNIDSRKLFIGMHAQPALKKYGCDCSGNFPVTEDLSANGLYLPSASHLGESSIARIASVIREGASSGIR